MHTPGPVSAALEAELKHLVAQHGVVLWPDRAGAFTDFVEHLLRRQQAGQLAFDVVAYRGSFLELMFDLETRAGGVTRPPLLVHLPTFDEHAARATPLLELIEVGHCFNKPLADIAADAAAEKVSPEAITSLRARDDLTLADADTWLAMRLAGQHAGVVGQLHALRLPAVVDELLRPQGDDDDKHLSVTESAGHAAVWAYLAARAGLTDAWRDACVPPADVRPGDIAFAAASWALGVEYVHDLASREPADDRLRAMGGLPRPLVAACRELAAHLRARPDDFYRRTADETERRLTTEVEQARAEDLGEIDTFRFEEEKVLAAALAALAAGQWDTAANWADLRLEGPSFWLRVEPPRQLAWELVLDVARLGQAIAAAGPRLGELQGLEQAVTRYVDHGAAVDRAHRHLERRRGAISTTTPYFERLRERLDAARALWSTWADAWARDFNNLCRAHGFLPRPGLQQRTLFNDVVKPQARDPGTTALFVVDALRFEMAQELFAGFDADTNTTATLSARLAELPTVTEVGMNVLAPVVAATGRLRPILGEKKIKGFHSGEYTVDNPATRQRAMLAAMGGPKCPWIALDEVAARTVDSLRSTIRGAHLVVVHSREIDNLGEADTAFISLASFDVVLHRLRAAWALLREAGVRRFVITSDHGFLLLSDPTRTTHGRKIDPRQRCVLDSVGADRSDAVRVPLADLGYEGATQHIFMPMTTGVFDTGQRPSFVHGGNSLQERVIPVISLVHRAAGGGSLARYRVVVQPREDVGDMHCLRIKVEAADQAALGYVGLGELELAVRTPEALGVDVELCQVRDGARLAGATIVAPVDREFELFFRLVGVADARVLVEVHHPTGVAVVLPCVAPDRYAVLGAATPARPLVATISAPADPPAPRTAPTKPPAPAPPAPDRRWLEAFTDAAVRQLFEHLAAHGELAEVDAMAILGGARQLRSFSRNFEEYAAKAPFIVRIEPMNGQRRYVREGTGS